MELKHHKDISRRRFLQKTAVGTVIASLPAKSVWGACSVSGALSGNLSQNTDRHDCTIPNLYGGRSPGGWRNYKGNGHSIFSALKQIKDQYGTKSTKYKNARACYISVIEAVMAHPLPVPPELTTVSHTVASALSSNGTGDNNIFFHLAAVYLNAYFGLYGQVHYGQAAAIALVQQIFLNWYMQLSANPGSSVSFSDSLLGYNDGSTNYVANCSI
ncbi:hypothetical protein [Rheinheimera sp.]|uniref:hypothetical protein n=1 Tax=Rheinheimera sp. TaxID=1869214 RepID=UPI0040478899